MPRQKKNQKKEEIVEDVADIEVEDISPEDVQSVINRVTQENQSVLFDKSIQEPEEKTGADPVEVVENPVIEGDEVVSGESKDRVLFPSLEGRLLHVKVGQTGDEANGDDIKNIEETLGALLEKHKVNCLLYVSNHAVDIKII